MKRGRAASKAAASAARPASPSAAAASSASASSASAAAAASSAASSAHTPAASSSASSSSAGFLSPQSSVNAYYSPLIGPEYQVFVPDFVAPPSSDPAVCTVRDPRAAASAASSSSAAAASSSSASSSHITVNAYFAQTAEWNPHLKNFHTDKRKQDLLDKYLSNTEVLFYRDGRHVDQDAALHFLHLCDYDIPLATRLLKPWQPPVDLDQDLDEEEMYPADPFCNVCRDGGQLMLCDICDKSYHAACVQLESVPEGSWSCPYHMCATCFEPVDRNLPSLSCSMCPTSYCSRHMPLDVKARGDVLGCAEVMCSMCLSKEEEYEAIVRLRGKHYPEGSCRRAFLHRLQMVLKREGSQLIRLPIVGGRDLDLYGLYTAVCKAGGIYSVLDTVGWKDIRRALRLPPTVHHQSALLKRYYLSILYGYEKQFFPFFKQLPLKKATAVEVEDEEEEEEAMLAMQQQQAAMAQPKKKGGKAGAAQFAADDYGRGLGGDVKDDKGPEDVLISLKVGMGVGGHGSSMKAKAKETAAAAKSKKAKQKEKEKMHASRKDKKQIKRGRDKKAGNNSKAAARAKRSRRGEDNPSLSLHASVTAASFTGPLKDHPSISIWTPTWWVAQQNVSAVRRHGAAAAAASSAPGHALISPLSDIQSALAAAMAAGKSASPTVTAALPAVLPAPLALVDTIAVLPINTLLEAPPMVHALPPPAAVEAVVAPAASLAAEFTPTATALSPAIAFALPHPIAAAAASPLALPLPAAASVEDGSASMEIDGSEAVAGAAPAASAKRPRAPSASKPIVTPVNGDPTEESEEQSNKRRNLGKNHEGGFDVEPSAAEPEPEA